MNQFPYSHAECCEIAARALRDEYDLCTLIDVERKRGERPDVLGWPKHTMFHEWWTHVAEVKLSREDMVRDSGKLHRDQPHSMGDCFWLFMPKGMVDMDIILNAMPGAGVYWILEDGRYEIGIYAIRRDNSIPRRNAELKLIGEKALKEILSPSSIREGKFKDAFDHMKDWTTIAQLKRDCGWSQGLYLEFTNASRRGELPDWIEQRKPHGKTEVRRIAS